MTNHIKSKEAKKFVATELEFHLKKVKNTWIENGLSEADAEDKAVQQMGSPIKLGQELNRLHRPRVDWLIIILLVTDRSRFLADHISWGCRFDGCESLPTK